MHVHICTLAVGMASLIQKCIRYNVTVSKTKSEEENIASLMCSCHFCLQGGGGGVGRWVVKTEDSLLKSG